MAPCFAGLRRRDRPSDRVGDDLPDELVARRTGNGFNEWNFSPHLGYSHDDLSLGLTGSFASRLVENPGTVMFPAYATTTKSIEALSLDGSWVAAPFLTLKLASSVSRDSIHYLDTGAVSYQDSRHAWNYADVDLLQEFTFGKHQVTTGVQFLRHSVNSTDIDHHTEEGTALFGSGVFECSQDSLVFRAMPGLRIDHSSLFDNQVNGKVGLSVTLKTAFRPMLFVNAASAFHSPAFNDLYWPQDAYSVGNPDLKPEHSRDLDAGAQATWRREKIECSARISYFAMQLDDMIVWEPRPDYIWTPVNIAASITGASIQLTFADADRYRGAFNLTQSIAHDRNTGNTLIYRPRFLATTTHSATWGRFAAGVTGRYTGRVYTNDANTASLPPCFTFDGNCSIALMDNDGMRLVYDILNMTDRMHATIEGYPLPGREHRLSLKIGF